MESIIHLLNCLNFTKSDEIDISSSSSIMMLICWLEDQKIRELTIAEREPLRTASSDWNHHFQNVVSLLHHHLSSQSHGFLSCCDSI